MAELEFELEYEGPALETHEMGARDFANAVLNAAEVFQTMNAQVNPNDPPLSVNIRATSVGSFDILLKLLQDTQGVFVAPAVIAGLNLADLIQMFAGIIRLARHRARAEMVEVSETPGEITATFSDGTEIKFPPQVLGLSDNYRIRHNINEIVRPVDGEDITSVSIKREDIVVERIDRQDVESLTRPSHVVAVPEELGGSREVWLEIVSPTFKEGNAWRFSDGGAPITARVTDEGFLASIESGEPFRKGDRLRCILHEVQWTDSSGALKNRREITEVLDHIRAPFQPGLGI